MRPMRVTVLLSVIIGMNASLGLGQEYDKPDRGRPGDEMIQRYLSQEAQRIHEKFAQDIESPEKWEKLRPDSGESWESKIVFLPLNRT